MFHFPLPIVARPYKTLLLLTTFAFLAVPPGYLYTNSNILEQGKCFNSILEDKPRWNTSSSPVSSVYVSFVLALSSIDIMGLFLVQAKIDPWKVKKDTDWEIAA